MAQDMDIGMKCIKYMLFISNFLFVMVGFLLISIGCTINAAYYDFEAFMESHHFKPAQLMVAIGVIIFFVALFGCIGAIKESTFLINMYGLLLLILLILEISAAIAAYAMRSDISEKLEENMFDTLPEYSKNSDAEMSWDFMQSRLGCCGVYEPEDWRDKIDGVNGTSVTGSDGQNYTVPESCCQYYDCYQNEIYTRGCLNRLSTIVSDCALMLGVGATCVAFVQLLGVVFAVLLAKTIRRVKTEEEIRRQENRLRLYEQLARGRQDEKVTPVLYTPSSTDA